MKRRVFSLSLLGGLGLGGAVFGPGLAGAQSGEPVEGQAYTRLPQPVPVPANGKIEVIEFFWYGCPHCYAFEPTLEPWVAKLPADVHFRRVHVAFDALKEVHQRLYYTLETLGVADQLRAKVFARFHVDHKPINDQSEAIAFAAANGLDAAKFASTFNSFSVQTKMRQGKQLSDAYRLEGVPTLGIQGRYITSPGQAGGHEKALAVADYLIAKVRRAS